MKNLLYLIALFVGIYLGYGAADNHYKGLLLEQSEAYKASIQAVRTKEQEWRRKAYEAEEQYQKDLEAVRLDTSHELDRLRKQLAEAHRVSSAYASTSQPDGEDRRPNVPKRIEELAEFSERCARRADELIVQVRSLQDWINKYVHD